MTTTPEIFCDLFSFLDKDQIERIQLVSKGWNNVIIHQKNILPLRRFVRLDFDENEIILYEDWFNNSYKTNLDPIYVTKEDLDRNLYSYRINFDGTNLSKGDVSSRYSQLTVDEVLTNLNDVVFHDICINHMDSEGSLDNILNLMKLATTKTGGRFRGRYAYCNGRFGSKLDEIFGKGFLNTARYKIHPN
jgi:hypothetical protein